jgi:uncharacterized membrane protein YdjX (TVP38/TMEM64 family)
MSQPRSGAWKLVVLAGLVLVVIGCFTLGRGPLNQFLEQLRHWGPVLFFGIFALCISFGVPPTPFLLVAGATFDLATNSLGLFIGYAVSLAVAYAYAHRLFQRQLAEFLERKVPVVAGLLQESPVLATVLVRLTPGFPYVLQNCLVVGVCRSFRSYLLASLPPLVLLAILYTQLGKGLLAGNVRLIALALFALLCVAAGFRLLARRRSVKVQRSGP